MGRPRWWPGWSGPRSAAAHATRRWRKRARELLNDRYLGGLATPEPVRWVDNQNARWGSCTPGDRSIRLSARLQGMPSWVIDYVLVHELAHLLEAGHTRGSGRGSTATRKAERAKGYLEGWSAAAPRLEPPPGPRTTPRRRRRLTESSRARDGPGHQLDHVGLGSGSASTGHQRTSSDSVADRVLGARRRDGEEADVEVVDAAARRRRTAPRARSSCTGTGSRTRPASPDSSAASRSAAAGQGGVAGLAVAAELEPPPRLGVQGQQHPVAVGGEHQGARGEVVGAAAARHPVGVRRQVVDVPLAAARPARASGAVQRGQRRQRVAWSARSRLRVVGAGVGAASPSCLVEQLAPARRRSRRRSASRSPRRRPRGSPAGRRGRPTVGSRSGCIQTASRASMPWRERSEPHSVEASRSRRGRSSRPTRAAKVCSAGPPAARRRRTASCSLAAAGIRSCGGLADDLVDPALDQRERGLEPGRARPPGPGSWPARTARPRAACWIAAGLVGSMPRICSSMPADVDGDAAAVVGHGATAGARAATARGRTAAGGRPRAARGRGGRRPRSRRGPRRRRRRWRAPARPCRPGRAGGRCRRR